MEHKIIQTGEQHILHNWEAATVEGLDLLSVAYDDVGKIALVQAIGYFRLASASPMVWVPVANDATELGMVGAQVKLTLRDGTELTATITAAAVGAEPTLPSAGASPTTKFLRGDKTWVVPVKGDVGLGNADNTSDADKPVSTAQATAISGAVTSANSHADTAAGNAYAAAIQRANHTGTQLASTISDFAATASAAAPVQSVNGGTGVAGAVTVNAATGASYNATTGALTVAKNNGQSSDVLALPPLDWTVAVFASSVTLVDGELLYIPDVGSSPVMVTLPTGSSGRNCTIRVVSTNPVLTHPHTLNPHAGDTIEGSASAYSLNMAGMYYFRHDGTTWTVMFVSQFDSGKLINPGGSVTMQANRRYQGNRTGTSMSYALPTTGLNDGDCVEVTPSSYTAVTSGNITVTSAGTAYIRQRGAYSGTDLSLALSTVAGSAGAGVLPCVFTFTWSAADGVWYYSIAYDGPVASTAKFRLLDPAKVAGFGFNTSAVAGLTDRTITLPDADVDLSGYTAAKITSIPKYNASSGNSAPAGTDAAIVAGTNNKALNIRACVVTGAGITSTRMPNGAMIFGNQDASIATDTKITKMATTYKTRVAATGTGPYTATAYPTETGSNTATGAVGTHMPCTLADHRATNATNIGVHDVTIIITTNDATPKSFYGKRRVGYSWNGSAYTQIAVETIGTDQDPQSLSPTITFGESNGYLTLTAVSAALSASGKLMSVHAVIESAFNGD